MAIDIAAPLTLSQLEDHLWASADLFRGLTDVEVQRDYVLALLFFRRACDIYAEETAAPADCSARSRSGASTATRSDTRANLNAPKSARTPATT